MSVMVGLNMCDWTSCSSPLRLHVPRQTTSKRWESRFPCFLRFKGPFWGLMAFGSAASRTLNIKNVQLSVHPAVRPLVPPSLLCITRLLIPNLPTFQPSSLPPTPAKPNQPGYWNPIPYGTGTAGTRLARTDGLVRTDGPSLVLGAIE